VGGGHHLHSHGRGFLYLVAVMDWASRAVLSWRLSNTMDTSFCVEAVEEALARFGKPEIFNTDQGSQFTSAPFTDLLKRHEIKISMDGRGRWMDNVFVERLWRSLKHEDIYLKGYADGREAKVGISSWMIFYNAKRPRQALGGRTPIAVWREGITGALNARAVDMMDNARALTNAHSKSSRRSLWRHDRKGIERLRNKRAGCVFDRAGRQTASCHPLSCT
jgi:putative transposase